MTDEPSIPTIDISPWMSSNGTQQDLEDVVKAVHDACSNYGFFNLVGHGVPLEARERIFECAKTFFALPLEEKMDIAVAKSMGKSFRGYEPSNIQTHQEGLLPDTKECFITGAEIPKDDPDAGSFSTGPNLWPKSLPKDQFEVPVMAYRGMMLELVKVLVKILALGLPKEWDCSPNIFDELTVKPSIPMRLLHYAPQTNVDPKQFGVGDHTDFGCVSILMQQEGTKGLEVWHPPTQTWIPVPVIKDAFVINIGDTMCRWTAGHYRSARHRVINYSHKRRYSVAFFLNGNLKLQIKPLDGSGEESSISEHIRSRLAETMGENGKFLR